MIDPSSVQAGVILRTLVNCGVVNSTDELDVLEQIQGSLIGSVGPPSMQDTIYSEGQVLQKVEHAAGEGEGGRNAMKRLERTRLGGGDFVKSFPNLPDAQRRTSAEVEELFEELVPGRTSGKVEFEKALFEHVEVVVTDAFKTMGTMCTSKGATNSRSADETSERQAVTIVIPKNLRDIERALDGWQKTTKVLLKGDEVRNIPYPPGYGIIDYGGPGGYGDDDEFYDGYDENYDDTDSYEW